MNCLIVDDDEISRGIIRTIVETLDFFSSIHVSASVDDALMILNHELIHVIFLDIEMPGKSGEYLFDLCKNISAIHVVIVSTAKQNAFIGFEHGAIDFILKPPSIERIEKTIKKIASRVISKNKNDSDCFFVKSGKSRMNKIMIKEINYIESTSNYISIYYGANSRLVISGTLKSIESRLPENFLRVHNSYLVPINKISAIDGNCVIINKKAIPVSRSNWKTLNQRLEFI